MLKKGNIPVTLFVISVVVLFVFALFALMLFDGKGKNDIVRGYTSVREFNIEINNAEFLGNDAFPVIVKKGKGLLGFERDVVSIEVRRVPDVLEESSEE